MRPDFVIGSLAEALTRSPELFPCALDLAAGSVALIRLCETDYEQASFLDSRIVQGRSARTVPSVELAGAVEEANLPENSNFIFHIGHVGSTLLSRLLGKHESIFSLREPEILRTLALSRDEVIVDRHLSTFLKLWSRTFDSNARALVKVTSFASDLAAPILARPHAPRALLMYVNPETYLATIFGGANAPAEAKALAPFRLERLGDRLNHTWKLNALSEGEMIAMSWACEALALSEAAEKAEGRAHMLDFDKFLAQPRAALSIALAHFGVSVDAQRLDLILSGREMRTYSKAPEYEYDADLRTAVLNQGRARHAPEIGRGLLWLDATAVRFPQLRKMLDTFS